MSLSASARECLREFGLPFAWGNAEHLVAAVARLGNRRSEPPQPANLGAPVAVPGRPRIGTWSEADGRLLLTENGVPVVPGAMVRDGESAARAGELYGEAAVKAVSSSLIHKSDIGAVRLGVIGADQMRASFDAVWGGLTFAAEPLAGLSGSERETLRDLLRRVVPAEDVGVTKAAE